MVLRVRKPRFAFFGTPDFAATVLEKLITAGFPPALVVCNPDRPVGRKKIITPPPVKQRIMNYESGIKDKIHILQPDKLDHAFLNSLFKIHDSFDFAIVAAYGKIIPQNILSIPRLGVIGVHPSLLPKYRGASPIQSAILCGEEETGVTLFLMDEKIDHGPVLATRVMSQGSGVTYTELQKQLAELAGNLLIEILPAFLLGKTAPQRQNEAEATYTKKFSTDDGRIEPNDLEKAASGENPKLATDIERKIRALNPEPGVWTIQNRKRTKLLGAKLADNKLILKKVHIEGKKPKSV